MTRINNNSTPAHHPPRNERESNAYRKGYQWGNEFEEIDHDGAWGYDGELMSHYLDGCRAGKAASRAGFKISWRRRA